MTLCWTVEPTNRPPIQQVKTMLLSTLDNLFSLSYYRGCSSEDFAVAVSTTQDKVNSKELKNSKKLVND